MAVHIVDTCRVKPVPPTKRHTLALSGLDLYWRASGYGRTVSFYTAQEEHFPAIVSRLKGSLSVLLADFYPVAGRLVEDPTGDRRLTLDCDDGGVEFIEAYSTKTTFAQLEATNFAVQEFLMALIRANDRVKEGNPIMSVQVTSFPGGGVAVGVATDLVLFDGFSFGSFMKAWTERCNGVPLSTPPLHARKVISWDSPLNNHDVRSQQRAAGTYSIPSLVQVEEEDLQTKILAVTTDVVEKLKAEASYGGADLRRGAGEGGNVTNKKFTSFECVAAYLWKARVRADKQQSDDDDVALRFRVNLRQRKLPGAYFGPAVIHAEVAAMKAGELRGESLGATASRIRNAINFCTQQTNMEKEMERLDSGNVLYDQLELVAEKKKESMVKVTEIVDVRRVGLYGAQFEWGTLKATRPCSNYKGAGVLRLFPPTAASHDLELVLCFTTLEMEGFLPFVLSDIVPDVQVDTGVSFALKNISLS